jgi:prepilin-type N-terminal cleavage/methylation domain-containing protein
MRKSHKHFKRPKLNGFTISELLIGLLIFSVISTFILVKLNTVHTQNVLNQKLKQAIIAQQEILQTALVENIRFNDTSFTPGDYALGRVAAQKTCPTNVIGQGCWNYTGGVRSLLTSVDSGYIQQDGVVVAYGTILCDVSCSSGGLVQTVFFDGNGAQGPNREGQDQIGIYYSFGSSSAFGTLPGRFLYSPTSFNFYKELFN